MRLGGSATWSDFVGEREAPAGKPTPHSQRFGEDGMALTGRLRARHHDLWQRVVAHPFVEEMGDGTLPEEKFRAYFIQDYVFVRDLVSMVALGVAKAPDLDAAGRLNRFLSGILDPESDLFIRAFDAFGVSEDMYTSATGTPATRAFGDFLLRVGYTGRFEDIAAVLYVTEGTYLEWGSQLAKDTSSPRHPIYQEWIDIHGPQVLGELVEWTRSVVDGADSNGRSGMTEKIFLTALRYEYLFFEAAYRGEPWPDE